MGLNINNKKTYRLVDSTGLMCNQHQLSNPNRPNAFGDTIGYTTDAYLAYEYEPFIDAVKQCFVEKEDEKGKYIQAYRSPYHFDLEPNTMSRDHILYTLALMKMSGNDDFNKKLSKNLRWKISEKYSFTVESWLWMKGISGNWFYMFLYYLIDIPVMIITIIWDMIMFTLGGLKSEVKQADFVQKREEDIPKRLKKFRRLMYPTYALYLKALTLYVSPNSPGKWILNKICLFDSDKQNFMIRLLLNAKVKREDVYSYKSMYGGRWTTNLSDRNDRHLKIIDNPDYIKENVVDVDILIKLYEESIKKK